jgi:hypothetical protein
MRIASFPDAVAASLKQLTELELCKNSFNRLPSSLSKITNLQRFDLSLNEELHLEHIDVETLAALPHLREVVLRKEAGVLGWSGRDLDVAYAVSKRLPHLDMWFGS